MSERQHWKDELAGTAVVLVVMLAAGWLWMWLVESGHVG